MVMLPAASTLLIPLELSTLPRERLRLNQRPMLMLSMELMDMVLVLDTLPDMALATQDPSMEDILPSPVMLLQPLLLDTLDLDTQEPSMEDMVATMAKETLRLSQRLRLRLMPLMALMEDIGLGLGYSSYAAPAIARTAVASYATPVISRPAIASYTAPAIATGYAGIARPAISSYT